MRLFRSITQIVMILGLAALYSVGQSRAIVKHNSNLRQDPSTDQPPIRKLLPPEGVTVVEPDQTNGYNHVNTDRGEDGWLWGKNLEIETGPGPTPTPTPTPTPPPGTPADSVSADWDKPDPQDSVFHGQEGDCAETGDGGDSDTNARKNRTDVPSTYHPVTWNAINSLQVPRAKRSRMDWTQAQLDVIAPFEGAAVTVQGFLIKVKPETSSASSHGGETTNCHAHLAPDVDWHMPLTANLREQQDVAIVVETTPRIRQQHSNWTVDRLKPWTFMIGSSENTSYNEQPVRISGWLMVDPEHQDMINSGLRSTLWEIHPITKIEVLKDGQWVDLDDLP
jgi:hypothetical protein